jgi:LDH2 family malate/lactate/ureidoglycolate dehydrogenase
LNTHANSTILSFEAIRNFIEAALSSQGLPPADALKVATLMAEADMQGSDGHGVIRLPMYIKRIQAGGINKTPVIKVVQERS